MNRITSIKYNQYIFTNNNILTIFDITSVCYIILNIWQHYLFRELLKHDNTENILTKDDLRQNKFASHFSRISSKNIQSDLMINTATITFMLAGITIFFANCDLKRATLKNATHKIYLWLLVDYVQSITIIIMEIVVLIRTFSFAFSFIGLFIYFILVDAILAYQLLVVHSFYDEEKSIKEYNYTQLVSKLAASQIEDQNDEELQGVELNNS